MENNAPIESEGSSYFPGHRFHGTSRETSPLNSHGVHRTTDFSNMRFTRRVGTLARELFVISVFT